MPGSRARKRAQQRAANKVAASSTSSATASQPIRADPDAHLWQKLVGLRDNEMPSISCLSADKLAATSQQLLQHGKVLAVQQDFAGWSKLLTPLVTEILTYCQRMEILAVSRCCLNWSDALMDGAVWAYCATQYYDGVSSNLLTEYLRHCQPAVLDLNRSLWPNKPLMHTVLLTQLQQLRCIPMHILQRLQAIQRESSETILPNLRHLTLEHADLCSQETPGGWELREQTLINHLTEISVAFPSLQRIEQPGLEYQKYKFMSDVDRRMHLNESNEQLVRIVPGRYTMHRGGHPICDVVWQIQRLAASEIGFALRSKQLLYVLLWDGKQVDSEQSPEFIANLQQVAAAAALIQALAFALRIDHKHLARILDALVQVPAERTVLRLDQCKVWQLPNSATPTHKSRQTRVTNLEFYNTVGPTAEVVMDDSLFHYLSACSSLRNLNIRKLTVSHRALGLFAATREAVKLTFCAVTLEYCVITQPPSSAH